MAKTYNGIDLSRHNIVTSWDNVANENQIDFIILRAGGDYDGKYKDSKFEYYYNACKMYEIPVGVYYDCGKHFFSESAGIECAKHFKDLLSGKVFEMPVYMDIEATPAENKKYITDATISFCDYMEDRHFFVGIYASDISGFKEMLDVSRLDRYSKWVARYGKKPSYVKNYGMWQYSNVGKVNGITGFVDLDSTTINYPKIIQRGGFNGN